MLLDSRSGVPVRGNGAIRAPIPSRRSSALRNWVVVLATFGIFAAAMAASLLARGWAAYAAAEVVGALAIVRAFCLVHELSHGSLLGSRRLSDGFGLLASLVCALPYYPWKRIHVEHHTWAGWREKDPTEADIDFDDLRPAERFLATWSWRLSLPLIGFSFSLRTFWNLPRLSRYFPERRDRISFIASMWSIALLHWGLLAVFGWAYAKAYLPAFTLFLFLMDPIIIAQHIGIPLIEPGSRELKPVRALEQERFARTLVFPAWFARHVLLGFNYHSLHHARPTVPGHLLDSIPFEASHSESWWRWLLRAKGTPLGELLRQGGH